MSLVSQNACREPEVAKRLAVRCKLRRYQDETQRLVGAPGFEDFAQGQQGQHIA